MDVTFTTNLSILIQFLTGIVGFIGLFKTVGVNEQILIEILQIEMFVQVIQFSFYIILLRNVAQNAINMAAIRYIDWFITTPIMLFTIIVYLKYEEYKEKNIRKPLTLANFINENKNNIYIIFTFNLLMLLFGFLGELNIIDLNTATIFGFLTFIVSFSIIYQEYAIQSLIAENLYLILFVIWSLYGVAYLFPVVEKNNTLNILDLFSKNFFGIFLYFKIKNATI